MTTNIVTVNYMGGLGGEFICTQIANKLLADTTSFVTDENRYIFYQQSPIDIFTFVHLIKMFGLGMTPEQYFEYQSYPITDRFHKMSKVEFISLYEQTRGVTKEESFAKLKDYALNNLINFIEPCIFKLTIENKKQLLDQGVSMQYFFPGSTNIYLHSSTIPLDNFNLLYVYKTIGEYNNNYQTADLFIEHLIYKYFKPIDINTLIPTDHSIDVSQFYTGTVSEDLFDFLNIKVDPAEFKSYANSNINLIKDVFDIDFTKQYSSKVIQGKCFDYVRKWYAENRS